jgi:hypothetical protein
VLREVIDDQANQLDLIPGERPAFGSGLAGAMDWVA